MMGNQDGEQFIGSVDMPEGKGELRVYLGEDTFSVRFWNEQDGEWRPTEGGFTLPVGCLCVVTDLLTHAVGEVPKDRALKAHVHLLETNVNALSRHFRELRAGEARSTEV